MTFENGNPGGARRTFGLGALLAAALAAAAAAGGGVWLVSRGAGGGAGPGAAEQKEQWQCPMHPTIVQDHPGNCPICGMKLVKVEPGAAGGAKPAAVEAHETWQCPMHPSIVQDHPGNCPVCGMKLVKLEGGASGADGQAGHEDVEGLAAIDIDPARQQLIGLRTAEVASGTVGGQWRTVGRVAIDETRVKHINLKVPSFVERIFVDFVGKPVRRGEPLFAIYSPELLSAQEEYLLALRTRKALAATGGLPGDGDALVQAARRKLELWDVPASEIERLEREGHPRKSLTFTSPIAGVVTKKDVVEGMKLDAGAMPYEIVDLSQVWVLAAVYESELRHVKLGMPATLSLNAYPNRSFQGSVSFVDPLLDPRTRTVTVRLAFANPTGELKPEMFGEVVLHGAARQALRIPTDAVIDSGTQKVVFVALGDGRFQPREVKVGDSDGKNVEVVSGLSLGERVVTRANFLVDSESRLRASLAALSSGGAAPAGQAKPAASPAQPAPADPHAGHGR
ncbi:MAG TPA: efflux RND transporter periplasmic adaptor subunit [Anaeromyxobacteraceae bacterium]|nr:efflux RND transporter periplasmic adaptor subunit [Anaeromyxobacteraceae bacterium]